MAEATRGALLLLPAAFLLALPVTVPALLAYLAWEAGIRPALRWNAASLAARQRCRALRLRRMAAVETALEASYQRRLRRLGWLDTRENRARLWRLP